MKDKDTPIKSELRDALIMRRRLLSEDEVREKSQAVHGRLRELPGWGSAKEIMLYWPTRNEVDTRPVFEELRGRGVRILFPRCREGSPGIMDAAPVSCETELRRGKYSIMEPDKRICLSQKDCAPDMVIVPGVAFGRGGNRIGFGGGYYDRFLSGPNMAGTLKVGICYEFQLIEKAPAEKWDQPVDVVVTNKEVVWIKPPEMA